MNAIRCHELCSTRSISLHPHEDTMLILFIILSAVTCIGLNPHYTLCGSPKSLGILTENQFSRSALLPCPTQNASVLCSIFPKVKTKPYTNPIPKHLIQDVGRRKTGKVFTHNTPWVEHEASPHFTRSFC